MNSLCLTRIQDLYITLHNHWHSIFIRTVNTDMIHMKQTFQMETKFAFNVLIFILEMSWNIIQHLLHNNLSNTTQKLLNDVLQTFFCWQNPNKLTLSVPNCAVRSFHDSSFTELMRPTFVLSENYHGGGMRRHQVTVSQLSLYEEEIILPKLLPTYIWTPSQRETEVGRKTSNCLTTTLFWCTCILEVLNG